MRTAVIRIATLLLFGTVFVETHALAQLIKLNVGYVGITSDNAAAFIARDTGIYARNGLDVQLIYMNSGSTAVAALISGDTPISQTAGPGVINATLNGSDIVMIAGGNVTLDYWMLSRPEIKTAEQLKGGAAGDVPSADARLQYARRYRRARFAVSGNGRGDDTKIHS